MKYKAIISDIDGTLTKRITNKQHRPLPTENVTRAVKKVNNMIPFILATARPVQLVTYLLDHLKLHAPCITLDGALILDTYSKDTLHEKIIKRDDYAFIASYCERAQYSFIYDEKEENDISPVKGVLPEKPLNVFVSELTESQVKQMEKDLAELPTIGTHKVPSWTNGLWGLNISDANVSKKHAVFEVAKILKIEPKEIIAIGDGYNDVPLLQAAGLKVAMGNAVPELKAIADYIAPSVEEDGVAHVIEKFIL